jgi:3D (Asp-Asp-Asp) domain-containing protein
MTRTHGNRRTRIGLLVAVMVVLAVALVGGVTTSQAKTATKKASLSVSVPASVKNGKTFKVKASGYSGKFDRVALFTAIGSSCAKTEAAETAVYSPVVFTISTKHNYKVHHSYTAATAGKHVVCAYLYSSTDASGPQKHKAKKFTVKA